MQKWQVIGKTFILIAVGGLFFIQLTGCATGDKNGIERVYHGFAMEVDSSIKQIKNLRYQYGVLGDNELRKGASSPGHFTTAKLTMPIPEYFEVSWETLDSVQHKVKIPVKGHLPLSVKNKTVLFVIKYDTVEAYIERFTPLGVEQTRFY